MAGSWTRSSQRCVRRLGLAGGSLPKPLIHNAKNNSAVRSGRSVRLSVFAFRDAEQTSANPRGSMNSAEHVSVAVDYYRMLHVPRVSRPDAIRKAYENLVKQPPAAAYSADTLFARAVLLKAAAESLTDPDLRRSYDAKLAAGHTALRVSQQDLPGALVVLQEVSRALATAQPLATAKTISTYSTYKFPWVLYYRPPL